MNHDSTTRREFVKAGALTAVGVAAASTGQANETAAPHKTPPRKTLAVDVLVCGGGCAGNETVYGTGRGLKCKTSSTRPTGNGSKMVPTPPQNSVIEIPAPLRFASPEIGPMSAVKPAAGSSVIQQTGYQKPAGSAPANSGPAAPRRVSK